MPSAIKSPIKHGDDYHLRSLGEAASTEREVESQSLAERQEARGEFLAAMRDPALVAERVGWMIDGNYGYGEMLKAKDVIAHPRMNRRAALTHLVGIYEWRCPAKFGIDAWKKLTSSEKKALDQALDIVIAAAEKEMLEEQRG
jgi:hypothetical protein